MSIAGRGRPGGKGRLFEGRASPRPPLQRGAIERGSSFPRLTNEVQHQSKVLSWAITTRSLVSKTGVNGPDCTPRGARSGRSLQFWLARQAGSGLAPRPPSGQVAPRLAWSPGWPCPAAGALARPLALDDHLRQRHGVRSPAPAPRSWHRAALLCPPRPLAARRGRERQRAPAPWAAPQDRLGDPAGHTGLRRGVPLYNNTPRKCLDYRIPAEVFGPGLLPFQCASTFPRVETIAYRPCPVG